MMQETILELLDKTPALLRDMLQAIPAEKLKQRRIPGKWSIHEHACHIAYVQPMLAGRIRTFIAEEKPVFTSYIPGDTTPPDELLNLDLEETLAGFPRARREFTELCRSQGAGFWERVAEHEEYELYTPYILIRHILMHDHTHMYRMEELWLTLDEHLPGGR